MSNILVTRLDIDVLVQLAVRGPSDPGIWTPLVPEAEADTFGSELWALNWAVAGRPEEDGDVPPPYSFCPLPIGIEATEGLRQIAYFRYQTATDGPPWSTSPVAERRSPSSPGPRPSTPCCSPSSRTRTSGVVRRRSTRRHSLILVRGLVSASEAHPAALARWYEDLGTEVATTARLVLETTGATSAIGTLFATDVLPETPSVFRLHDPGLERGMRARAPEVFRPG